MADFNIKPDNVIPALREFDVLIARSKGGVEWRRAQQSAANQEWTLEFTVRTRTEYEALQAFYDDKTGASEAFTWGEIVDGGTAVEHLVRFSGPFQARRVIFNNYDVTLKITKVK